MIPLKYSDCSTQVIDSLTLVKYFISLVFKFQIHKFVYN